MNTVNMKIVGFDEESKSLLVSFASDETASSNPEDYPAYAYQPSAMWPDVVDVEEIKRRIAYSGIHLAKQQAIKERFESNIEAIDALRNLVGDESTHSVEELVDQQRVEEEDYMYIDGSIAGETPDIV